MNKHPGSVAAPAMACDEDAHQTAAFAAPVLERTLDHLRAEHREQVARSARRHWPSCVRTLRRRGDKAPPCAPVRR